MIQEPEREIDKPFLMPIEDVFSITAYFEGSATKEEALDLFYKSVLEKYPELTY